MPGITKELAETIGRISYSDLSEGTVYKTKQLILDCIGCALEGIRDGVYYS